MTYQAPTETNPPWTTPATWPFKTTSERWEADYRLKLLESALIYLWNNIEGGTPIGPAGGDLGGAYPNPNVVRIQNFPVLGVNPQNGQVLQCVAGAWTPADASPGGYATVAGSAPPVGTGLNPPEGFLWIDTSTTASYAGPAGGDLKGTFPSPQVGMNLPAPLGAGQPITSFTDSLGDVWVAKGGVNGGAYKRARDVLYTRVWRNATLAVGAGTNAMPFDTVQRDLYGLWNTTTQESLIVPISGLYFLTTNLVLNPGTNAQILTGFLQNGITIANNGQPYVAGFGTYVNSTFITYAAAGDTLGGYITANVASTVYSGVGGNNYLIAQYMGTG